MARRLFTLLSALSLLLCAAVVVLWARSYRGGERRVIAAGQGWYALVSASGRLTLLGPPPVPAGADPSGDPAPLVAGLRNDQIEFATMFQRDVRIGWEYPSYMSLPEYVAPARGTPAHGLDEYHRGPRTVRLLLAALDRPQAFVAAHVLLSRRFDAPDFSYVGGGKGWSWTDDTGDIRRLIPVKGADRPPPRGPVRGHYRGLRIELRPPPDEELNFSGAMAFPCHPTIDPDQLPALREAWHRRLDVPLRSAPHSAAVAATLALPGLWCAVTLRRAVRARRRSSWNLCPSCGYDLRATPGRCPECGAVPAYCLLLLALTLSASSCSRRQAGPTQPRPPATAPTPAPADARPPLDQETLGKLWRFKAKVELDPLADETILAELSALNRDVPDDCLATVERFAATAEARPIAWPLARLLVERRRPDAAADVIVAALADDHANREYRMWKWWEFSFGGRPDYQLLTREISDALLNQFARGSAERKQVVAELFGKGAAEAKLTVEQFRAALAPATQP